MKLFLLLEHLVTIAGLLISLISVCLSENKEAQGEGERWGNDWSVEHSEHTQHLQINFTVFYGSNSITTVTSKITGCRSA